MTLKDYLASEGIPVEEFAATVAASPGMIHKIVYRQRQPSLDLAARIEKATNGQVSVMDMHIPRVDVESAAA